MQTGENEQGLRKILDLTRMISIILLGLHFYYFCYQAFEAWQLTSNLTDRIIYQLLQVQTFCLRFPGNFLIRYTGKKERGDKL